MLSVCRSQLDFHFPPTAKLGQRVRVPNCTGVPLDAENATAYRG